MTVKYRRGRIENWIGMTRLEVRIWNLLSEESLESREIVRRLPGVDFFDIVNSIQNMRRKGELVGVYD